MLLDRIGDRDVKLIRREGQCGGISLLKQDAGLMLPGEADEFPVPIQAEDLRLRIPPVQRPGQSAGTAADLQDAQGTVLQIQQLGILFPEAIVKPQSAGGIQGHAALDVPGPDRIHRIALLFHGFRSIPNRVENNKAPRRSAGP